MYTQKDDSLYFKNTTIMKGLLYVQDWGKARDQGSV